MLKKLIKIAGVLEVSEGSSLMLFICKIFGILHSF
jgi:hypothetical protein